MPNKTRTDAVGKRLQLVGRALAESSAEWREAVAEIERAHRFVSRCLRLAQAAERALVAEGGELALAGARLEDHFDLTHEDEGFAIGLDSWELRVDACQGRIVRISVRHPRRGRVDDRSLTLDELDADRAREEMARFFSTALARPAGSPRFSLLSNQDPAARRVSRTWPH